MKLKQRHTKEILRDLINLGFGLGFPLVLLVLLSVIQANSINVLYAIIGIIPMAIFNIALGLLCGSVFGVKLVGGICGALLTGFSAWFSDVDCIMGYRDEEMRKLLFQEIECITVLDRKVI